MRVRRKDIPDDAGTAGQVEERPTVDITQPCAAVFHPLLASRRYKDAVGGRGSGKSHFYCEEIVKRALTRKTRVICVREIQRTLEQSVKSLLESKIRKFNAGGYFDVQDSKIICPHDGLVVFEGMQNHTADSIKSYDDFDLAFVEEAHRFSQRSLELLYPTIRAEGGEVWFARNRHSPKDPVDKWFRENANDPDFVSVFANYWDNPWFPEVLRRDMERDKRRDPDKYAHIWAGGYQKHTQARVFTNWRIDEFETPIGAEFGFGADWGYSVDPSVLVRRWIKPGTKTLYIDYEAYAIGCEINFTPFLFGGFHDPELRELNRESYERAKLQPWAMGGQWRGVPQSRRWLTIADSARPETIAYMRKHGFPLMRGAKKGPGSVQEGIEFLRDFDIVIHPRCVHVADEFANFSYKIHPLTQEVMPVLSEKKNHTIDSARYSVEGERRATGPTPLTGHYQQR